MPRPQVPQVPPEALSQPPDPAVRPLESRERGWEALPEDVPAQPLFPWAAQPLRRALKSPRRVPGGRRGAVIPLSLLSHSSRAHPAPARRDQEGLQGWPEHLFFEVQ